ncbi:MAG TPA: rod-binding protein [Candidatus Brocadiia bacterium]|nr:rod-binding protein [Planctomycetota bacterium]MDO8094509.1 rod-binding protein [Candidatus Brocadiales bacterium]
MSVSLDPSILTSEQLANKLENLSQAGKNQRPKDELKKAAQDFEAVLVNFLIKAMWKTIPDSGLYDESNATDAYTDIMQSALSEEITRMGGFGIAQKLYEEMQKSLILTPRPEQVVEQNKEKE